MGTFSGQENPGIFGNHSENIFLRDVTLYHTASMGICHLREDHHGRLKTIVRPGPAVIFPSSQTLPIL